jgi:hypothetical protein
MVVAEIILLLIAAYMIVGLFFGIAFVMRGALRIDEAVHGAPIIFRILILPGCAAFWPLMAFKWRRAMVGAGRKV